MCIQKASLCGVKRGFGRRLGASPRSASRMSLMFSPAVNRSTESSTSSRTAFRKPFSLMSSRIDGTGRTDMNETPQLKERTKLAVHFAGDFLTGVDSERLGIRQGNSVTRPAGGLGGAVIVRNCHRELIEVARGRAGDVDPLVGELA